MTRPVAFRLRVQPSLGVPVYRQLVEQIRAQVMGGQWNAGDFLPSVRQVAQELEINPMTVSKAYSLLERENVLRRVPGLGMAVADGIKSGVKERRDELSPLLEAVAQRARDLNLTRQQIIKALESHLDGMTHE